jgi:hypothetical protein
MTTCPPLKSDDVLMVGNLRVRQRPNDPAPTLVLHAYCCFCRTTHAHPWRDASARTGIVVETVAKCDRGPLRGRKVFVGLDPDNAESNWSVAERFRAARHATRLAAAV